MAAPAGRNAQQMPDPTELGVEPRITDSGQSAGRDRTSTATRAAVVGNPLASSRHWSDGPGAHAMFFDGHTRFLRDDIDSELVQALLSPAGGEAVPDF